MKLKKLLKSIGKNEVIRLYYDNDRFINTTKGECLRFFTDLHERKIKEIGSGRFREKPTICIYLEN